MLGWHACTARPCRCLQAVPVFDAKGIETVRRDTCPVVAKMMEATLRLLFASKDLSQVGAAAIVAWQKPIQRWLDMHKLH